MIPVISLVIGIANAAPMSSSGTGSIRRWAKSLSDPTILYYLDSNNLTATQLDSARIGLAKWSEVPTSYISLVETLDPDEAEYTITVSTFKDTAEFLNTENANGERTSATLKIGLSEVSISGDYFINFITHETGHILGLRHTTTDGAIMSYRRGNRTVLNVDDEFAITRIYPADGEHTYNTGCASVQVFPPSGPIQNNLRFQFALTFLLILSTYIGFRRRNYWTLINTTAR